MKKKDYTVDLPEFPDDEPMDEIEVDEVVEEDVVEEGVVEEDDVEEDVEVEPPRKRINYKGQILEIG